MRPAEIRQHQKTIFFSILNNKCAPFLALKRCLRAAQLALTDIMQAPHRQSSWTVTVAKCTENKTCHTFGTDGVKYNSANK